jgi:glycosyltransferase involved in cell wall biosynthesis
MATDLSLSIVIMAFNEEDNLPLAATRAIDFLQEVATEWQLIIVNDGSSDQTGAVADSIRNGHPSQVDVIHHAENQGMGAAIRHGYGAARCEWITQLPADCQVHPDMFRRFLPHLGAADLILSVYAKRDDGILRKILSAGFQTTIRLLLGHRGDFTGTMVFKRSLLADTPPIESDTFFANMEFPILALRSGAQSTVVEIEAEPRLSGESKVKNLRRVSRVLSEIVKMRMRLWRGAF